MVFSSLTFLFLFFPLVMGVYYLCPRALRNLWLLLTSLLFYAWGEPVYIRLMAASILFNYLCGLGVAALQKREKKRLAKGLLILCIAGNIGALGLFKYADLLIGTVNNIAGSKIALLELALPIGISFYTFQALSYVIDVYRGTVAAQKNPITFGAVPAAHRGAHRAVQNGGGAALSPPGNNGAVCRGHRTVHHRLGEKGAHREPGGRPVGYRGGAAGDKSFRRDGLVGSHRLYLPDLL